MKRTTSLAALAAVVLALLFTGSAVAETSPVVVASLTSHQKVGDISDDITELAKVSDLPTWFASMLKLYGEGKGVAGLDASRPWGAVIQGDGQKLSAYAFIPVTDAEWLSWELEDYIDEVNEVGYETYHVIGTDKSQELYAKVTSRWVYVANDKASLASVAADPAELLGSMPEQYDAALRLETRNIPADKGEKIIGMLDKTVGPTMRKVASDEIMDVIGEALMMVDQITMGWTVK